MNFTDRERKIIADLRKEFPHETEVFKDSEIFSLYNAGIWEERRKRQSCVIRFTPQDQQRRRFERRFR